MNASAERSTSCWMRDFPPLPIPPLHSDAQADVVVVGAGMAGMSIAFELVRHDFQVLVIDRGSIGMGMTARTTAHLSTELDDYYHELIRASGVERARHYYQSQVAAVNRIEAIVQELAIDCDFQRVDGFLVAGSTDHQALLEREFAACRSIDVDGVEWVDRAPFPGFDSGRALRFPTQARFHPLKYLRALMQAIIDAGGKLHAETACMACEEDAAGVRLRCENGATIRAAAAVFATNTPVNDLVTIHTKQVPYRTYAIAGRVPRGTAPDVLLWDTLDPYHYVRLQPLDGTNDLLIVGGEDHRTGEARDMLDRLYRLETWAKQRYPSFARVEQTWSGQVLEPVDFLPFSGRNPGNRNVYIHTGDSGQGITNAVAGSLTILPLILGEDSRFAEPLSPGRVSVATVGNFVEGLAGAVPHLAAHLQPGEIASAATLKPGEGAIVRRGLRQVAAYRDRDGALIERLAACTHMGCVVQWNRFEECWECACHGSQFAPTGDVLNGPALKPLAPLN